MKHSAFLFTLTSIVISSFTFSTLNAQEQQVDECAPIISKALIAKRLAVRDDRYKRGEAYLLCSMSNSDVRSYSQELQSESGGGGGSLDVFGLFSVDGSGSGASSGGLTDARINTWKSQNCKETNSALNESSAVYSLVEELPAANVEAWRQCRLNSTPRVSNDLKCFADPSRSEIAFEANWRSTVGLNPRIDSIFVSRGGKRETIDGVGDDLRSGKNLFIVTRSAHGDHRFVLTAHSGGSTYSCTVLVPGTIEPELSAKYLKPIVGDWCGDDSFPFLEGAREFSIRDGGDRVIFRFRPTEYVPPKISNPPSWYKEKPYAERERGPAEELRRSFHTLGPGLIGLLEGLSWWDNNHEFDGESKEWKILPTQGQYVRSVLLMRKQGQELWLFRIKVKSPSREAIDIDLPQFEREMRAENPYVYQPCPDGIIP